ncbi:hypothetical protein [Sorangium sp. So ce854]|uniref:hypothetical protein n=1 Tax=Sorangium sp. So ce854 TaxID=3133322 RepID=UPI003F5F9386
MSARREDAGADTPADGGVLGGTEQAVGRLSAAILRILAARGVPASEEVKGRIIGETHLDVLERWLQRAASAATVEELFRETAGP